MVVKEFRIVLATPPLNQGEVKRRIAANSDVTGHVLLVLDKPLPGFKAVEVSLNGRATVGWTPGGESSSSNPYREDYITGTAVLWSDERVLDGQIPAGSHQFSFLAKISTRWSPATFLSQHIWEYRLRGGSCYCQESFLRF